MSFTDEEVEIIREWPDGVPAVVALQLGSAPIGFCYERPLGDEHPDLEA